MSEKSVLQKLGLKAGRSLLAVDAPADLAELLGPTPEGARWSETGQGRFPLILLFARSRVAMVEGLPHCKAKLEAGGALWIAYAKASSGKAADINRDSIREHVVTIGLDTVAQIAIDADWSALRLKVV
jgi:Protein of unknown function (DUF3052)